MNTAMDTEANIAEVVRLLREGSVLDAFDGWNGSGPEVAVTGWDKEQAELYGDHDDGWYGYVVPVTAVEAVTGPLSRVAGLDGAGELTTFWVLEPIQG